MNGFHALAAKAKGLETITFRWLEGEEATDWLNPVLQSRGWALLNPATSRALCAFQDERMIAFHVLQLYPHAEPMFVDPEFRGTGLAEDLADRMYAFLREVRARAYMVVAESPFAEQLCKARGMKRVEYPVYIAVHQEE